MGSSSNSKWLDKLRDSLENHSESLPDGFWEELKRDIPSAAPVVQRRTAPELLILAVAAVVLLGLVLFVPQREESAMPQTAVAESGKVELQENVDGQTGEDGQMEKQEHTKQEQAKQADCRVQAVKGHMVVQGKKENGDGLQPDKLLEQAVGENSNAQVMNNIVVGQQERVEKAVESEMERKIEGESRREDYLKELDYLRGDDAGRKTGIRKMVAVAAGCAGVWNLGGDLLFAGGDMANSSMDGVQPSQGMGSMWGEIMPENYANFINMAIQPVENVSWLGGNSPTPFNNAMACKSYNYNHREPVRLGVSFAVGLVGGLYAESGISYQYLASEMLLGSAGNASQKLHYIGIPIRLGMNFMRSSRFQVYLSGGYMLEKCVYGVLELPNGNDLELKLPGVMNSVNVVAGLQFMAGDHTALYVEPGMYSYLGMGDEIGREHGYILKNRYSKNPTGFSMQGGVRFLF